MIEEGALEGVDIIFGGHIETRFEVGKVGVKTGVHTAYTDSFDIEITGRGGHAARPHEAVDAIVIASQAVNHLQTVISRETDPLSPSVISVGFIQAGTTYNVIAERAVLRGTIRTIEESVRSQLIDRIKDIASALSNLYNARIDVRIKPGYPPAINHDRECRFARDVAKMLIGDEGFISIPLPSLGGEDFAYYTQKVPGCFLRFGAAKDGYKQGDFHSPEFDFDEEVLRVGAAFMSELVRYAIKRLKKG
jgi:hippurate hydrolase